MKRQMIAALCLCMAGMADAGDAFLLQTKNTTLALRRENGDRKSTRLNSSHPTTSRMPSSA